MKIIMLALSLSFFAGCKSTKVRYPETREPAQEIPNTELGEPVALKMGAATKQNIAFLRKICAVVDATQGDRNGSCLKVVNETLKSRFDQAAPSPASLDLSLVACEIAPRRDQFLEAYYKVRTLCLQNASALVLSPNSSAHDVGTYCGASQATDGETARLRGDCFKRLLQLNP